MITRRVIVVPSRPVQESVYVVWELIGEVVCEPLVPVHGPSPLLPVTVQEAVFWLDQFTFVESPCLTKLAVTIILAIGGGGATH